MATSIQRSPEIQSGQLFCKDIEMHDRAYVFFAGCSVWVQRGLRIVPLLLHPNPPLSETGTPTRTTRGATFEENSASKNARPGALGV